MEQKDVKLQCNKVADIIRHDNLEYICGHVVGSCVPLKGSRETLANPSNGVHHVGSESKLSWRCSSGLGVSRCITDNRLRPILTVRRKSWRWGLCDLVGYCTVHSSAQSTSPHPPRRYRISLHSTPYSSSAPFGMGTNDGPTGGIGGGDISLGNIDILASSAWLTSA